MAQDGFIRVPPDSTGKKVYHTIVDTDKYLNASTIRDSDSNNHWKVDAKGQAYMRFAEGEQMISQYGHVAHDQRWTDTNFFFPFDTQNYYYTDSAINGGSISKHPVRPEVILQCDTSTNAVARRTTDKYHRLFQGTVGICGIMVSVGDGGKENVIRRWGLFDDYNGYFFHVDEDGLKLGYKSYLTGSLVTTLIAPSGWTGDKLDGTGDSGITIDVSKPNIYFIEYIGNYGSVRFFIQDPTQGESNGRILLHQTIGWNEVVGAQVSTVILPVRFEQYNTDTPVSLSQMFIGAHGVGYYGEKTVIPSRVFTTHTPSAAPVPSGGTEIAMGSIRLNPLIGGATPNRKELIPLTFAVYNGGLDPVLVRIRRDATLTGATWNTEMPSGSTAQIDRSAIIATGGDEIFSYIIPPQSQKDMDDTMPLLFGDFGVNQLRVLADLTPQTLTITGQMISGIAGLGDNPNAAIAPVTYSWSWKERI